MKLVAAVCCAAIAAGAAGCVSNTTVAGLPVPPLPDSAKTGPDQYVLVTVRNEPAPLASRAGSTPRGYDGAASYAVSGKARSLAHAIAVDYQMQEVTAWPIAALRVHCILYHVPTTSSRDELLQRLQSDPRVQLAQPLQTFATSATQASGPYDDPYLGLQNGLREMSVLAAQQWSRGAGVTVAVVDTGIDIEHPDLAGRVRHSRNFVDHDQARFEHDRHGTEVAGVIAAVSGNGQGIVGVAPQVELLALKACWEAGGAGTPAVCNSFTLAQALQAAIDAHVGIINLSLVGPADKLLSALTIKALEQGTIVVGAVPPTSRTDGFPAGVPGVIAVDMAEHTGAPGNALLAPGREVLTLAPGGHYDFATGSSLATASVSGIVALMRAVQPQVTAAAARMLLANSTRGFTDRQARVASINACTALSELLVRGQCPGAPEQAATTGVASESTAANH